MSTDRKKTTPKAPPSNPRFALQAEIAVNDDRFVKEPSYCQKFTRQVIQAVYGSHFDRYHKPSAQLSLEAWKGSEYAVAPERGSVIGDILYKKATKGNPYGHVGVRVAGNRVAENSTVHGSKKNGGKGFRTLERFGKVDLIVRLPVSAKVPTPKQ